MVSCNEIGWEAVMSEASKMPKEAVRFRIEGIRGLSSAATSFLRKHPKEARLAVAAALEAAAVQFEARGEPASTELPTALQPFVVRRAPGEDMLGVSEAAERLQISRTTVYDWVEKNILLGWKSTKRGLTIPAEQIRGPGNVIPGIAPIVEIVGDPELTWAFLSQEWPFADKASRPLDKLKAGKVVEVVNAAPSFGTAVT
jgi:excisionase family DNA binding protein